MYISRNGPFRRLLRMLFRENEMVFAITEKTSVKLLAHWHAAGQASQNFEIHVQMCVRVEVVEASLTICDSQGFVTFLQILLKDFSYGARAI